MLVYSIKQSEIQLLENVARDVFAFMGDKKLNIVVCKTDKEVNDAIGDLELLELAIVDITADGGLDVVKTLKKRYSNMEIMLIADTTISPMVYINPNIKAASLILKPYTVKDLNPVMKDFLSLVDAKSDDVQDVFWVESDNDKLCVPLDKIYYIEARDKKVFIRLNSIEYPMYDTIENLSTSMPPNFIRCHRSYIVNTSYISKVKFSDSMILLTEGKMVPLSRSYKSQLKGIVKNDKG